MELKKYKLGEILDVIRGASLSGEFYATEGEYIRLTCAAMIWSILAPPTKGYTISTSI
jgi:hypothetical protein